MNFEEQIAALTEFGKAVKAGAKPGTVVVPEYSLKPEEFGKLSEIVSKKDDDLKVGFANALFRILLKSTESAKEEDIQEYQRILLSFAKNETRTNTLNGILKAMNHLFLESEGKWDELVEFLLNEKETEFEYLRGQFIAVATYIRDSDFASTHREKLLKAVATLLESSNKDKLPVSSLIGIMSLRSPEFKDIEPYIETIWKASLYMAETENFKAVCPALHDLREVQGFKTFLPKCIDERIKKFSDENVGFEFRISAIKPIIRLFPFLDEHSIEELLTAISRYAKEDIEIGIKIVDLFEETEMDLVDDDSSILIAVIIRKEFDEDPISGLILFAPLADIVLVDEDFEKNVNSKIEAGLSQDPKAVICSLYALKYTASRLQAGSVDLFKAVLGHIPEEGKIGQLAFDAIDAMFETTLFSDENYVKEIIAAYGLFTGKTSLFSKLITELLDKCDDPGVSVAQPIYEFAVPLIATTKPEEEKALGLRLLTELSDIDKEFVEDRLEDMMTAALDIIKSANKGCVAAAANLLASVSTQFAVETRDRVLSQLPLLVSIVKREVECDENNRNSISTAVCDIISNFDLRDEACDLAQLAAEDIKSENEDTKAEAVDMLFVLCKSLLPDTAIPLFNQLAELLEDYKSSTTVDTVIKTLKALMKKYRVDKAVAKRITQLIFEGKVPAVGQIDCIENPETAVFRYLKAYTKKYKAEALPFIHQVVSVLPFIDSDVLSEAFTPIEAALKLGSSPEEPFLDKETAEELADTLMSILSGDDNDSVGCAAPTVSAFRKSFPGLLDDELILKELNDKLEMCDDENDKENIGAILSLIISIAANGKCNEQLVAESCAILPLSPESCDLEETLHDVNTIADRKDVDDNVILNAMYFLGKVVLMKKTQLEEYDITGDILQQTRKHITALIKAKPQLKERLSAMLLKLKLSKVQVTSLLK